MEKRPFYKTRKGAACVMVVLILLSCWIGSSRSLGKLYRNAEAAFGTAQSAADVSIEDCLTQRKEYARNLMTVGNRVLSATDKTLKATDKAVTLLEKAKSIGEKYDANVQLTDACANLYDALLKKGLDSTDEMLVKKTFQNFKSLNDQISHASYNELARKYNDVLRTSPLSVISGQKPAELFQ